MIGKILVFFAIAAICDAAISPLSNNWSSPGCRTRREIDCLSGFSGSDIEYNRLFNILFPGTRYDTIGDFNFDGVSYDRTCDPADYFAAYPEVRACKTCPGLGFDTLTTGLGCGGGSYGCGSWPKCLPGCFRCDLCCRSPRCSFPCERVIGPCYPEHVTCA